MFHCINQEQYDRHFTNYAWHRQRGGESVRPLISPDPYVIDGKDVEQISQEESLRYFLGRARTPASSPESPREEVVPEVEKAPETELDILAEAAKEFVLDYTEEGTLSAEKVFVEVEVDSGETEVEEPLEEALDLREVVQRELSDSNAGLEAPEKEVDVGSTEGVSVGVGSRRRQPSTSSVSSSSLSTSSSSESLRRSKDLMDTLATLVKQSADLINNSVDRVEGIVRDLADTLNGVAKKIEGFSDSLGKCRCGEGAQGSGDGADTEGVRQVREDGDSRSRSKSKTKVRDDRIDVGRNGDQRQKQSDGKSRSRSKSKVRDDRTDVGRNGDQRQKQIDRRDRSRSRGRSGRRLDNDKGHRVVRISWRSRSRSVDRGRRQRDGGVRQGELREGIKDRDSQKYRCNERDRDARRDEERQRRERSRSGGKKCRSKERTGDIRQDEGRQGHERSRCDG